MKKENDFYRDSEYEEAKKRVNERVGFYVHLSVYIIVNSFLHILNLREGGGYWAFYPLLFWGVGLSIHGINALGFFNNSEWKNKQIQKEIERQRRNKW